MFPFLINLVVITVVLFLSTLFIPGFEVHSIGAAVFSCLLLGFMNFLLKPMLVLIKLATNSFTIALFSFVMNALLLNVTTGLTDGFTIESWTAAVIMALVLCVLETIMKKFRLDEGPFTIRKIS